MVESNFHVGNFDCEKYTNRGPTILGPYTRKQHWFNEGKSISSNFVVVISSQRMPLVDSQAITRSIADQARTIRIPVAP